MMGYFSEILNLIKDYMGAGYVTVLFLFALIAVAIFEKDRIKRCFFLYMPTLLVIIFLCPITYSLYGKVSERVTYYRLLWLIPETIVIAYAMCIMCGRLSGKKKALSVILCALIIAAFGKLIYTDRYVLPAENIYHMPQYVVDICDALHVDGREVQVVVPEEMQQFVRQYDPCICIPYGRQYMMGMVLEADELRDAMNAEDWDGKRVETLAFERYCHYIVLPKGRKFEHELAVYEEYMTIDGYVIYRNLYLDSGV